VDGVEYAGEVLAEVVSQPWLDVMFFRGGGIVLIGLAIGSGVRWIRLARTATAEPRGESSDKFTRTGRIQR
jgi:hypothetical protein